MNEKLDQEEAEAKAVTNQNKWMDMTMELTARQNFELIQMRVREARKRRATALHCQQVQDKGEQRQHEDMKWFKREQRQHKKEQRDREKEQCDCEKGQSKGRKH